ncbi:hypothetical protein [Paenibacillus aquistagni]|uniref:hypothetical protein n=1 Tax=Paenibacillus aquistagni TaxID=1852522 RepID=UPI00145B3D42|nr:hypothetical protein [Paenibacillus aquistagni]NMM52545.1 hypothetical protein [Paenibacillus aquistagni]
MTITQAQLNTLNSFIKNYDKWSALNNCSSFAVSSWNTVLNGSNVYTAGTPNTPRNLANSIKDGSYTTNASVPFDYVVYYANGTGAPIKSSDWN